MVGAESRIEWTDATSNPWYGCDKIHEGCLHCYAERWCKRTGRRFGKVTRASQRTFELPLRLEAGKRVFVCSLSDFLHPAADAWRGEHVEIMRRRPDLTFIIPTKRPERLPILRQLAGECPANWWIGYSASTEASLEAGMRYLTMFDWRVRFLSLEPLLDTIELGLWLRELDWVIVGGESGPRARPMSPIAARRVRNQCLAAGIPFFFKQWGEFLPASQLRTAEQMRAFEAARQRKEWPDGDHSARIGRELAGRLLDGHEWSEWPKVRPVGMGDV